MDLTSSNAKKLVVVRQPSSMPLFSKPIVEEHRTCLFHASAPVGAMGITQRSIHDESILQAEHQKNVLQAVSGPAPTTTQLLMYALLSAATHTTPVYTPARATLLPAVHPLCQRSSAEAPSPAAYTPLVPPSIQHITGTRSCPQESTGISANRQKSNYNRKSDKVLYPISTSIWYWYTLLQQAGNWEGVGHNLIRSWAIPWDFQSIVATSH